MLVDSESVGAVSEYTFERITKVHTLKVVFQAEGTEKPQEKPQDGMSFEDVNQGNWFYNSVKDVVGKGWFSGVSEKAFMPNLPTSRGMIVTVLWNMEQKPNAETITTFEDVAEDSWYYGSINWAQDNGIVMGDGNENFAPNDDITREQAASILYRLASKKGCDVTQRDSLEGFGDAKDISGYAVPAMEWAAANGTVSGKEDGRLDPKGTATRAEVAAMLSKFGSLFYAE